MLRGEAFERALEALLRRRATRERLRLLATYGSGRLRKMLTGVYETLRSAGRPLVLELGRARRPRRARSRSSATAAQCLLDDPRRDRQPARGGAGRARPARRCPRR